MMLKLSVLTLALAVTAQWHQQEHQGNDKICYVLHGFVGTIFSHDKPLA